MLIVICGEYESEYIAERNLCDTGWDATVQDIANGQFEDVSSVIHASMGVDVLDILAREVMTIWANRGEPLTDWQRKFIEFNVSIKAANRFMMDAAE